MVWYLVMKRPPQSEVLGLRGGDDGIHDFRYAEINVLALARSDRRPTNAPPARLLNGLRPHRFESHHPASASKKTGRHKAARFSIRGGDDGIRTHDPHVAKATEPLTISSP